MLNRAARHYIRYVEVAALVVLSIEALLTYRELSALRKAPVALPNYQFEMFSKDADTVVQTSGTWISEGGIPEPMQTITIECRKSSMRCVESAAVIVFVEGKGVLESNLTVFEVEEWSDKRVVAKPQAQRCATRTLTLDLVEKRARSHVTPTNDTGELCRPATDRSLELVAGYKLREQRS